ncbi:alpha/beta hydrolase [Cohnella nanjingensis]|uniref:Lysophospholipase n=1 Tax=Cohnella nanjingensis TaxID=1387779 RepID=A0A7X0VIN5_9BACL|nr:alpha/beta hydrolase [Cohnella nanjingensis]MBB6674738.1 lysophospholipase [Cohnella nanjingensis]
MAYRTFEWQCKDGTIMQGGEWRSDARGAPGAVIGLVHGMGEHIGRYGHVAEMLTAEGYAVLGFDQRGHGRTAGKRGHTPSFDALLEGIDRMLDEARRLYPGVPVFLYAHSMGGNVALNYLLRRQPELAGAIVTGPWLKLAFSPPQLQVVIGRVIERVYPKYTNHRPMNVDHLTTDPEMAKRYRADPLGHGHITAAFFFGIQRAGLWALRHAGELRVPTLLMHGGHDRVTSILASRQFAEAAGSLCEFKEWPGFNHELHNELLREDVFADVRDWLRMRLAAVPR